jgi:NADH dehydrogenase (ubiquinone) 1 alpha subcomplex subunit 5
MRFTRLLRSAKWPTGITGLHVQPQARNQLLNLYTATLNTLKEIPEHAVYRQAVEALTKDRLRIVQSTEDTNAIEAQIGQGLVEEVIAAAEKELVLVEKMKQWQAYVRENRANDRWEKLEVEAPEGQWTTKATVEQ